MRLVRGQVSGARKVSHVEVWTQIPATVLPPGQMAKCENCDSVHWQRQQSSVQVREPETGVEKVKWLQRTGPQVYGHCSKRTMMRLKDCRECKAGILTGDRRTAKCRNESEV